MSSTTSSPSETKPFIIDLGEDLLSDLQGRLAKTRMPVYPADGDWSAGTDPDYLKELLNFWQHSFDWRKQQALLAPYLQDRPRLIALVSDNSTFGRRDQYTTIVRSKTA